MFKILYKTATVLGNGPVCKSTICTVTAATSIWTSVRLLLSSGGDDACEIGSLESRTTDKTAVDILLGEELSSIARLHGATILDTDRLSRLGADELCERLADKGMDLLSLIGRGGLAGADRPHRLVRNHELVAISGGDILEADVHLALDDFVELSGFALLERLADAHDCGEACSNDGAGALVDGLVRHAEVLATLGVADNDILGTSIDEHSRGDLARVGAARLPVGVLGTSLNLRTLAGLDSCGDVDRGRAAHDIDIGVVLRRLCDLFDESSRLGRLNVHLPVTGNDFLAHFCFDLSLKTIVCIIPHYTIQHINYRFICQISLFDVFVVQYAP